MVILTEVGISLSTSPLELYSSTKFSLCYLLLNVPNILINNSKMHHLTKQKETTASFWPQDSNWKKNQTNRLKVRLQHTDFPVHCYFALGWNFEIHLSSPLNLHTDLYSILTCCRSGGGSSSVWLRSGVPSQARGWPPASISCQPNGDWSKDEELSPWWPECLLYQNRGVLRLQRIQPSTLLRYCPFFKVSWVG